MVAAAETLAGAMAAALPPVPAAHLAIISREVLQVAAIDALASAHPDS